MVPLKRKTLKCVLDRSVSLYGINPALSMFDGATMSYAQLGSQVKALSRVLEGRGIRPGDRVALLSENMPNWGVVYFAVTTMGAIVVPVLPDFHASDVHHILRHSEAKALFVSKKLYAKLEDVTFECLESIFIIDDFSLIPSETTIDRLKEVLKDGRREFVRLKDAALKAAGVLSGEVKEDDVATIIYTSGTTGHSKGVMLTHKNLVFDCLATLKIQMLTSEDRLLSVLPLSHTYECTIGFLLPLMQGAHVVYIDKPPVGRVLLPILAKVQPTMMLTVPLIIEKIYKLRVLPKFTKTPLMRKLYGKPAVRKQLHKLAAKKIYKLFGGNMHFFGIGGALLSPDVEQFLRDGKFPYAIGYGLTETSPLIAGCTPSITRYRATGVPLPGLQVKINNPDPGSGEGEIWVKGDSVMKGYYRDPERTKEVITDEGWFKTGDLGILEDGYLYIKGRLKNVIIGPSGENIYPEEIESVINRSDLVLESLVYHRDGEILALVHLNYEELDKEFKSQKLTDSQIAKRIEEMLEALRKEVNKNISGFSRVKKMIEQPEPFEKTPTKKVKRYLYLN